jgi:glucan phosphoethanolaminetransferase (alkaline phosphatase superfamily)
MADFSSILINGADYVAVYLLSQLNDVTVAMLLVLILAFVLYLPLRCIRIKLPLAFLFFTILLGIVSYTALQKTVLCKNELGKEYPGFAYFKCVI